MKQITYFASSKLFPNAIKIGTTKNDPAIRVRNLSGQTLDELTLIGTTEIYHERDLHRRFRNARIKKNGRWTEWFELTDSVVNFLSLNLNIHFKSSVNARHFNIDDFHPLQLKIRDLVRPFRYRHGSEVHDVIDDLVHEAMEESDDSTIEGLDAIPDLPNFLGIINSDRRKFSIDVVLLKPRTLNETRDIWRGLKNVFWLLDETGAVNFNAMFASLDNRLIPIQIIVVACFDPHFGD